MSETLRLVRQTVRCGACFFLMLFAAVSASGADSGADAAPAAVNLTPSAGPIATAPDETSNATPGSVVDALHGALLGVMKDSESLGYKGRFEELSGVLPELFDIDFMAEKSIGRYWRRASEQERAHLLATFTEFTVANYAGNFDGYTGETFETLDETESTHGTVIVRSRLVESDGDIIQLDYRLREVDGEWRIIDIYFNGTVSELALRRSEYSTLIEREGFDSLLVALNQKITELSE